MSQFFPAFVDSFNELLTLVKDKKIAVVGHMRPDGDCIGSQFALADFLRQAAKKYDFELILQPKTNPNNQIIPIEFAEEIFSKCLKRYKNIRLIPQVHKFLDIR